MTSVSEHMKSETKLQRESEKTASGGVMDGIISLPLARKEKRGVEDGRLVS